MIKTRLVSTAAAVMFGLAALGGTVVAVAAPANAATSNTGTHASTITTVHAFDATAGALPLQEDEEEKEHVRQIEPAPSARSLGEAFLIVASVRSRGR